MALCTRHPRTLEQRVSEKLSLVCGLKALFLANPHLDDDTDQGYRNFHSSRHRSGRCHFACCSFVDVITCLHFQGMNFQGGGFGLPEVPRGVNVQIHTCTWRRLKVPVARTLEWSAAYLQLSIGSAMAIRVQHICRAMPSKHMQGDAQHAVLVKSFQCSTRIVAGRCPAGSRMVSFLPPSLHVFILLAKC